MSPEDEEVPPEKMDLFRCVAEATMTLLDKAEKGGVPVGVLMAGTLNSIARFYCGHLDPNAPPETSLRLHATFENLLRAHWEDWVRHCQEAGVAMQQPAPGEIPPPPDTLLN